MQRREFCVSACQFVSLAAATSISNACGSSPTSPSDNTSAIPEFTGTVTNGAIVVPVANVPSLAAAGGVALVIASGRNVLVSRQSDVAFSAVTAICTHQSCIVNRFADQRYVCPCHGSQYTFTGAVVQGPAPRSLDAFPTTFNNGILTISV